MDVYKTKEFARFARKEGIGDERLCEAVAAAERGQIDADLGGGVIKQRVARQGQGKSGGWRTTIAYRSGTRSIFLHGFAKSRKSDLDEKELRVYRSLARAFLQADADGIRRAIELGELHEIECDEDDAEQIRQ